MMRHMLAFIFLCLSYSIEGRAQEIHCDTILEKRIYEYIGLFKDYLQFMSNEQKSLETRCYYEKKAKALFSPNSYAIIYKDSIVFQSFPIDSLLKSIRTSQLSLSDITLDSIQVPNWNCKTPDSQRSTIWVECKVISIDNAVTYRHQDSLMLAKESTEKREEWHPLLGNLYISYIHNHVKENEIKKDNSIPLTIVDCTLDNKSTVCQRVKQKHVRCKSKTRGRIPSKSKDARKKNLLMLLNLANYKSANDAKLKVADSMMQQVIIHKVQLHYADSLWFAKVKCKGSYKGKDTSFFLYLTIEQRGEDMYKWVIQKAEGKLFELTPKIKNERIMLMPDDHETRFISLHRITTDYQKCVTNFANKYYQVDPTTVFFTMVQTGLLKIDFIDNVKLTFLQIPEYAFSIEYFDREGNNSGWLIDNLWKMSNDEKEQFLNNIYTRPKSKI